MDFTLRWVGECDGHVVIRHRSDSHERVIDRLGDLIVTLGDACARGDAGVAPMAAYGICLSTRGVKEPAFVRQILEKAFRFVGSADPASKTLYDVIARFQKITLESSDDGAALRRRLLEEAHVVQRDESARERR